MSEQEFYPTAEFAAAEKLAKKMWKTKSCRFNAHSRLKRQNLLSTISISVASLYITAASIASLSPDSFGIVNVNLLSFISCIASILVIIISIIENGAEYSKNAHEMHMCGREVNKIYDLLRISQRMNSISEEKLSDYTSQYHMIIEKYPQNHSDADVAKLKIDNKAEFDLSWRKLHLLVPLYIEYFLPYSFYYLIIIIPIFIITYIFLK